MTALADANPSTSAYFCTTTCAVGNNTRAWDMIRLIPAKNDTEAVDMALRHVAALLKNGFNVIDCNVTFETHELDPGRGICTASRDVSSSRLLRIDRDASVKIDGRKS